MAALDYSLLSSRAVHDLVKRKNWAAKQPGIILVFCIIGAIAILLTSLMVHRKLQARKAAKA